MTSVLQELLSIGSISCTSEGVKGFEGVREIEKSIRDENMEEIIRH
jgi:hypothetical protein